MVAKKLTFAVVYPKSKMTPNYNLNADNVNDNNINESNTNAEVSSMVMVGLGGRNLQRSKRSAELLKQGFIV